MDWNAVSWHLPAGIILLALGGDMLVRGAAGLAKSIGVSRLFIGVTLVSLGTSMPELVTSVRAALLESPGIAVGNVVGSNISNILLVLGTAAIIYPLATPRDAMRRDGVMVVIATVVCIAVVMIGFLDRQVGIGLVVLLLLYFLYSYYKDNHAGDLVAAADPDDKESGRLKTLFALMRTVAGVIIVLVGANWLVESSITLARAYNVSETIIGLSIVAIGTSLPELITAIMAAIRRETAIALGNVLGSNIQNILGILGITAIVHPIEVPVEIAQLDIWIMSGATIVLILFALSNWRLSRLEGLVFLLAYIGYISYLYLLAVGSA